MPILRRSIMVLGLLSLASLFLPWWLSYYSRGYLATSPMLILLFGNATRLTTSITPLYFGTSPGVQLQYTSFGKAQYATNILISLAISLIIVSGALALIGGSRKANYALVSGIAALAAALSFVIALSNMASGFWVLAGSESLFGSTAYWGVGPGFLLALASGIAMLFLSRHANK